MAKNFTDQEKQNIRLKLLNECEKSWDRFGFKKTSVDELCAKSGISKGAFYLFFESKEALFCETLCKAQDRLYALADNIMESKPNKYGFADVLKAIYSEYDKCSLMFDTHSIDFITFTNKLNNEQLKRITEYSEKCGSLFFDNTYLKFKVNRDKAISTIYALLSIVSIKEQLPYYHIEVFEFMVDNLIDKIFE